MPVLTRVVRLAVLAACAVPSSLLVAQNVHPSTPPETRAVKLQESVHLDGRLDEAVWQSAPPATDFRQNQPREGQAATQRTEVRFAYDAAAIYVGARMFDTQGAAGVRSRLVRRDADPSSDYLEVIFDTYHDHIGRLFFQVNPSGVRFDANGLGGGGDESWDPVWEVKTAIDSLGWTAEMRIPFAQMRFPSTADEQTWGLQIWRQENRLNELSQWAFWGLQESGGPPWFGHLTGLVIQRAPGRAELLPYMVGRSANVPVSDPADPFQKAHSMDGRAGVDARVLLTSNLTLNATVNPDFGQVEVDPAVVNLSAFETFFDERRPFFIEGAGYFGFGGLSCYFCSNVSSLSMFYTRRVGRSPQMGGNAFTDTLSRYADVPENTTILGAAKLTGRTPTGWSLGVLDAVTKRERAEYQRLDATRGSATVEPLANYFVGRVAKDLRGGATVVRAMATSVTRQLDDSFLVARLSRHAESVGLSTEMYFGKRDYRLMAQLAGTQVTGDTAALRRLQRTPAHYFQRPDADVLRYDSTLTAMRGLGGYARFSRETGRLLWEVATNFRSPSFENNDIAFLSEAGYVWMGANVFPQWTKPTTWYRWLQFIGGGQQRFNYDGDRTDAQVHLFGYIQPLNYWDISAFFIHRPSLLDDRLSRGGPVLRRAGLNFWSANVNTDRRKNVSVGGNGSLGCADGLCDGSVGLSVQLRPASNITLSLGPSFGTDKTHSQFVRAQTDSTATAFFGRRYIFADVSQRSVTMDTRFNVTFSPNLTLELYAQPLIASGAYSRYKEFAAPRQLARRVYGVDFGTATITPQPPPSPGAPPPPDRVTLDPDGAGPIPSFSFDDQSFTLRSLRGNAVLRWEYRPGSTVFVVWARNGFSSLTRGTLDFGEDFGALFEGPSENVFLVKFNFWLGI